MKIAITGASGFIGKRFMELGAGQGHSFVTLGRKNADVTWDANSILDPKSLDGVDAVVHLAGEPVAQRWSDTVKDKIMRSRVDGTGSIVDALGKSKVKILVCASAVGYYGFRGDELLAETSCPGKGFLPDVCVAWEAAADRAADFGVSVVKLRIAMVLGRGGGALATMETPFKLGVGGKLGSGEQWMSWIHLEDMARLILFALNKEIDTSGLPCALNATAPNPVTNADFTRLYGAALHRPVIFPVPEFALQLLYGEMAQMILGSQRVIPTATERMGFQFRFPDLASALKEIYG